MSVARSRSVVTGLILVCAFTLTFAAEEFDRQRGAVMSAPVTPHVTNVDLRSLPAPPTWRPGDPVREIPRRFYPAPDATFWNDVEPGGPDPLAPLQQQFAAQRGLSVFTSPLVNIAGLPSSGAQPPDTVGDVGPTYYIQAINGGGSRIRVWDKTSLPPTLITTFTLDSLGSGSCANGLGDPIILYDRLAERWMISEFSSSGNNLCVYVSQTPDPLSGGWFNYGFAAPQFPDYPKYGVWPTDANGGQGSYIVTSNESAGGSAYALNRGAMLNGQASSYQRFVLPSLAGFGFQAPTPADLDGPDAPPTQAPAIIMRHRDTEVHNGPASAPGDLLEMWRFDVDWQNAGNTVFQQIGSIDVADFSSELCGLTSFSCIDQPNSGTNLDPLREVIMNRLQYMHHADDGYETLVGNFVIDVSGTEQGGIRWFELRRVGGAGSPWTLHQEGTWSIDSTSRWMAGSSMDQSGNIALAYNVSSGSVFPGQRYTGRLADDPLGVMTAGETSIVEGSSPNSSNRYGDYSAMNLDPADDCTFWFTGMWNPTSSYQTRISAFKFDSCGCLLEPSPVGVSASTTEGVDNTIDLSWSDSDLDTVIAYEVRRSRTQGGPYETIATVEDSNPGFVGGPDYFFSDTDVSGAIEYFYVVVATDGSACKSDTTLEASAVAGGRCSLRPLFDGLLSANIAVDSTCGVALAWLPATPECGDDVLYNVYRSTDPSFVPAPSNLTISGIAGTGVVDENAVVSGESYHYIVRAIDTENFEEDLNDVKASVVAGGSGGAQAVFVEDFENAATFADWTVTTGPGFHRCGEFERSSAGTQRPSGGAGAYALSLSEDCAELLPATSTKIDSPAIDLDEPSIAAVVLDVDLYYNHNGGETATIEVWDGGQWVVVWTDSDSDFNGPLSIDVSAQAIGNADFRLRFNYQGANDDRWYAFDNVRVGVDLVCSTASAPNPVPNSLTASLAGSQIDIDYDAASCPSAVTNLLYGPLSSIGSYAIDGSLCAVSAGSFSWSPPAGDLWYLLVGGDANGTESSWGLATLGERNGLTPSGECATTLKNLGDSCPLD